MGKVVSDSCRNQKCRPGKQGSNKHLGESADCQKHSTKNNLHVVSYLLYWLTLGILLDRIVGCFQHLSTNFHLVPATVHVLSQAHSVPFVSQRHMDPCQLAINTDPSTTESQPLWQYTYVYLIMGI